MNVWKVLGGVACLSLLIGTGALAEMEGGEPGTSKNPKANVPQKIQRANASGSDEGSSSGPGKRSDALAGMEKVEGEKSQKEISAQSGHKNMKK